MLMLVGWRSPPPYAAAHRASLETAGGKMVGPSCHGHRPAACVAPHRDPSLIRVRAPSQRPGRNNWIFSSFFVLRLVLADTIDNAGEHGIAVTFVNSLVQIKHAFDVEYRAVVAHLREARFYRRGVGRNRNVCVHRPRSGGGGSPMSERRCRSRAVDSRAIGVDVDVETLKTILLFCGAGLFLSLLAAMYGLDLSGGVF
jgi:hypothetical protein